jgi:hypothetical protein
VAPRSAGTNGIGTYDPVESVWECLRQNRLSNRVFESYGAIANACWNLRAGHRARDDGTLVVNLDNVRDEPPDPRLYRALEGGGYISREAESIWNRAIDPEAADAAERRARRRKRRAARKRRRAAQATPTAGVVKDPGELGGSGGWPVSG